MSTVISHLRSLDRKERFAILREALGIDPMVPFLDPCFRRNLHECIDVKIPKRAFLAMDYHLDWIQMALYLSKGTKIQPGTTFGNPGFDDINNNQEDVDLLIAFEGDGANRSKTHLVLIEAKAYLHWDKPQLEHKVEKLKRIFGRDGRRHSIVIPHFVLMTGREPRNIRSAPLPEWQKDRTRPFLLKYRLQPRFKITRCTDPGDPSKGGSRLRLDPVPPHAS